MSVSLLQQEMVEDLSGIGRICGLCPVCSCCLGGRPNCKALPETLNDLCVCFMIILTYPLTLFLMPNLNQ